MIPSVCEMNRSANAGDAVRAGVVFREIRAIHDEETIRVYQAYNAEIAQSAVKANSFLGPLKEGKWSATRMTWIKPSAVWMAYRCGWSVMKDKNQAAVLALDLSKPRFLNLLRTAVLSHGEEVGSTKTAPVVVQWDPERLMSSTQGLKEKDAFTSGVQQMRSIQIGLRGQSVEMLLDPKFVLKISDVTEDFQKAYAALCEKDMDSAVRTLWPQRKETRMVVPLDVRDILQMDSPCRF